MSQLIAGIQSKLKVTSAGLALLLFKFVSGLIVALTVTLILEEMIKFGPLSFVFLMTLITVVFLRLVKPLGFWGMTLLDLFCILIALLLRMYVLIAPG